MKNQTPKQKKIFNFVYKNYVLNGDYIQTVSKKPKNLLIYCESIADGLKIIKTIKEYYPILIDIIEIPQSAWYKLKIDGGKHDGKTLLQFNHKFQWYTKGRMIIANNIVMIENDKTPIVFEFKKQICPIRNVDSIFIGSMNCEVCENCEEIKYRTKQLYCLKLRELKNSEELLTYIHHN